MPEAVRRRRRWPLVVAAGLVVAIMLAAWQLRSEKLAGTILGRLGPELGLELSFEGTPSYTLSPEPTLTLPGFVAKQPGADAPLLRADRLQISLPWETIRGAESREITRVELDAPVLDLAALAAWQATRPDEPFEVPTLTQGLAVQDGTLVGDGWRLADIDVSLPRLKAGEKVEAELAGRFERGTLAAGFDGIAVVAEAGLASMLQLEVDGTLATGDGEPTPFNLAIAGPFDATGDDVRLLNPFVRVKGTLATADGPTAWQLVGNIDAVVGDRITAHLTDMLLTGDGPMPELQFDGHVALDDTLRVDLGGAMARWPAGWPALPPPLDASRPMTFVLGYAGASDLADPLRLRLQRDGTTLDARAVVPEVMAWMDRPDASPLPPIDGLFETPTLTIGAFTLDGIRIEFEDGVPVTGGDDTFAGVDGTTSSTESDADPTP